MKTIFIALLLLPISAVAQTPVADIEVSYTELSYYGNGTPRNYKYHLLANSQLSKFFNPRSEEIDSMNSTPEGAAKFKEMQQAAIRAMMAKGAIDVGSLPRKREPIYVVKSNVDSMCTVYDMLIDEPVYYTEPFSELTWEIGDSTKTVLGYECVQAHADYHGRRWTAWFAPEIPIHDGPWKFRGLPGLILEVTSGRLGYVADGIVETSVEIRDVYSREAYERQERKEILRTRRRMIENPMGVLNAKNLRGVTIKPLDNDKSMKNDFIETDYR